MRVVEARERSVPISRYADPGLLGGGLTTSVVAVVTDVLRERRPVVGYGFGSFGRFAQGGLIRERFAPRLLEADDEMLVSAADGGLDPFRAWDAMMAGEKPGGHGERCVAVGTLDMALWDAAAKIAGLPLYKLLAARLGRTAGAAPRVPVYACGGYRYPRDDWRRLAAEISRFAELGYTRAKIKVGGVAPAADCRRIETALRLLPGDGALAIDAMNSFGPDTALGAAEAFSTYPLWWFEDICDPLDFGTLASVASVYQRPIAAGEALFSAQEATLLDLHGGLRRDRDILVFDPVHCYGLRGYCQIVERLENAGWQRAAFWPHGGHLFCLHVVAALGLGGAEVNPLCFQPFGGLTGAEPLANGCAAPPDALGIGFEEKPELDRVFASLLE